MRFGLHYGLKWKKKNKKWPGFCQKQKEEEEEEKEEEEEEGDDWTFFA